MRREVPTVRILPMSDKLEGFRGLSIEEVQEVYFRTKLPSNGGRFQYPVSGLNAQVGTVVLFQYRAHIIASGIFVRDERLERPVDGFRGHMCFEVESLRTFEPVDVEGMRKCWPGFRGFGHVKQYLNPAGYPVFKRRRKKVKGPASKVTPARGRRQARGI